MEIFWRNLQRLFWRRRINVLRALRRGLNPTRGNVGDAAHILTTGWTRGQTVSPGEAKHRVRRKRTEIMIEIDELIWLPPTNQGPRRARCSDCGAEALMLTPQEAAAIGQVSVRQINRSIEAGEVHFLETAEGLLLVCMNSLGTMRPSRSLLRLRGIGGTPTGNSGG